MPRIKEVMTRTELSATTSQTPRRSTRRQPAAVSNGVSGNTPSAKNLESSKTAKNLKSTKDSSLKVVKNAKQIVKNLPSSREKPLEADAEDSGSSLSDLDIPPGEEDSAPNVNQVQSQSKSGERSKSPVKAIKAVEEKALGVETHKLERTKTEESVKVEEVVGATEIKSPNTTSRKRKIEKLSIEEEEKVEISKDVDDIPTKPKQRKKTKREEDIKEGEERLEKPTRKRKTKEKKESEVMPLAARTNGLKMFVGAHVSSAKGPSWKCFNSRASWSIYLHRRMLRICQFN